MQLKEGQKWDCPTSIFLCKTNNALNLDSFYIFHCFLSILFVAIFLKVYKCERKFSKLVGKIKPAFLRKTFDFLSETKDKRSKALSYVWPKEISSKQHFQHFESNFNVFWPDIKLWNTRHHSPFLLHFPFLARFCI